MTQGTLEMMGASVILSTVMFSQVCMHMSKLIELYSLYMCSFSFLVYPLCVIEAVKRKKIQVLTLEIYPSLRMC